MREVDLELGIRNPEKNNLIEHESDQLVETKGPTAQKKKSKRKEFRRYTYTEGHAADLDHWIKKHISSEVCNHGKIAFQGVTRNSTAHFACIPLTDAKNNVKKVFQLITEKWHIKKLKNKPNLIVSVIGSLSGFDISNDALGNVKDMIREICQIPGTWIVTEGTHAGVAKLVGSGLCEESDIVCIGIPKWGTIKDQDMLIAPSESDESRIYQYQVGASWMEDQEHQYLDPNHTHFLMIKNNESGDDSELVPFRTEFERHISIQEDTPYVMIVINGHIKTFKLVCEMVKEENTATILLVRGSGGVADLLIDMILSWESHLDWRQKMKKGRFKDELSLLGDIDSKWEQLFNCKDRFIYQMKNSITDTLLHEKSNQMKDLITNALLREKSNIGDGISKISERKLKLSLLWNRPEIIRELLPLDNTDMVNSAQKCGVGRDDLSFLLKDLLIMALCRGNVTFVKMLLLDYEVGINTILSIEVLELLYGYQTHEKQNFPRFNEEYYSRVIEGNYAESIPSEVEESGRLIREVYGYNANWDIEKGKKFTLQVAGINQLRRTFSGAVDLKDVTEDNLKIRPFFELFIWSVVCNLPDMSKFLWPLEGNQMAKALLASFFWEASALSKDAYHDDTVQQLQETDTVFKEYAQKLLDQCYSKDKKKTAKMITTKLDFCGGTTCLELAVDQGNMDIVSHSCPQHILHDVWTGPIQTPEINDHKIRLKRVAAFVFPFLINILFKFEGEKERLK